MRELTDSEIAAFDSMGRIPSLQVTGNRATTQKVARRSQNSNMRTVNEPTRQPRWARASRRGGALPA